jgi:hypothetical protein
MGGGALRKDQSDNTRNASVPRFPSLVGIKAMWWSRCSRAGARCARIGADDSRHGLMAALVRSFLWICASVSRKEAGPVSD